MQILISRFLSCLFERFFFPLQNLLRHPVGQILLLQTNNHFTYLATIYIELYSNNSTVCPIVKIENYRERRIFLDIVGKIYFLLFCTIPNITAIYKTSKCMYISDPSVNVTSAIGSCKVNMITSHDDNSRMTIFETFKRHFSAKFEKMLLQYST